ncbi:hypothetical protein ACFFX0_31070 [Citricoccus parietis]|uniref:Uncharacterized protein n=1 Tax=Citricoccus parietis TaxID=592307 RepID=A0ABV5G8V8_9MICC
MSPSPTGTSGATGCSIHSVKTPFPGPPRTNPRGGCASSQTRISSPKASSTTPSPTVRAPNFITRRSASRPYTYAAACTEAPQTATFTRAVMTDRR